MTTSGVITWPLTVSQVCQLAAEENGAYGGGRELTSTDLNALISRLTGIMKVYAIRGLLFMEATGEITIPAASASGTLEAEVRDILAARLVVSPTNERMLQVWNRGQYLPLPNKAASGSPTAIYVSKGTTGLTVYVWPVPTAETTIKIDYSRAIEVPTAGTETLDMPQDWLALIVKKLALDSMGMFMPDQLGGGLHQKLDGEVINLERIMLDADRPDSYVFEPYGGNYY